MDEPSSGEPEAAWRQRKDWVKGEVEEEGARNMGSSAASAALMTLVAGALLTAAWLEGGMWWFFALVAGTVATALLWRVVRQALQQRKFGRSHLLLQQTPLRPGKRFVGKVRTGIPRTDPAPRFRVQIECARRWKEERGSGDDRKTEHHRKVLWSDGQVARGELHAGSGGVVALAVPLAFDLARRPETTAIGTWEGIAWELKVEAEFPGLDYQATFELPVFEGEADRE